MTSDPNSSELANETAKRLTILGYVCIVPNLATSDTRNPIIDGVWQAMRAADVLQATNEVHGERIGFVGNAMSGKLGLYAAALDQRFVATSTIMAQFSNPPEIPTNGYSVAELIAAVAPRALQLATPADTTWSSQAQKASPVYAQRKAKGRLAIAPLRLDTQAVTGWLEKYLPAKK